MNKLFLLKYLNIHLKTQKHFVDNVSLNVTTFYNPNMLENKNNNLLLQINNSNMSNFLISCFFYENTINYNLNLNKYIQLAQLKYSYSIYNHTKTVWIKLKNKVTNGYGTIVHKNKIIYNRSIGSINNTYKEEKYGNWLLSRKLQRFLLLYKWKKPFDVKNVIVCCTGIKRFFRSSLGHITQLFIRLCKRYFRIARRYFRWLLKFVRIAGRRKKKVLLTYRQRLHTMWLRYNMKNRKKQLMLLTQLRLMKSYSNNNQKVRKRKGKFDFGY